MTRAPAKPSSALTSRPIALARLGAVVALLAPSACARRPKPVEEAPRPVIVTSSSSPFELARGGTDPAFRTADGALFVYVSPGDAGDGREERRIAGIALGDARGPRYGLLSGAFAPLVAPAGSAHPYRLTVSTDARGVTAAFGDALRVRVRPPREGRAELLIEGPAVVLVPGDKTEVRGTLRGEPSAAFQVSAGEAPGVLAPRADHLELTPRGRGAWLLDTPCERTRIVRPTPRGSTSVFALHLGVSDAASDPLFGVEPAGDGASRAPATAPTSAEALRTICPGTVTSTLTVPWPG